MENPKSMLKNEIYSYIKEIIDNEKILRTSQEALSNQYNPLKSNRAIPIPFFGNIEKAKVAVISINPSQKEFTKRNGETEERFLTAEEYKVYESEDTPLEDKVSLVYEACKNYFDKNPYNKFFAETDNQGSENFSIASILKNLGFSFYQGDAVNIDLSPFVTEDVFSDLAPNVQDSLFNLGIIKHGQNNYTLPEIFLENNKEEVIFILNGSSVIKEFNKRFNLKIDKELKKETFTKNKKGDKTSLYYGIVSLNGTKVKVIASTLFLGGSSYIAKARFPKIKEYYKRAYENLNNQRKIIQFENNILNANLDDLKRFANKYQYSNIEDFDTIFDVIDRDYRSLFEDLVDFKNKNSTTMSEILNEKLKFDNKEQRIIEKFEIIKKLINSNDVCGFGQFYPSWDSITVDDLKMIIDYKKKIQKIYQTKEVLNEVDLETYKDLQKEFDKISTKFRWGNFIKKYTYLLFPEILPPLVTNSYIVKTLEFIFENYSKEVMEVLQGDFETYKNSLQDNSKDIELLGIISLVFRRLNHQKVDQKLFDYSMMKKIDDTFKG